MKPIAVYSGQEAIGSWGWRHALTWRQLSALWGMQVELHTINNLPILPTAACAYSFAISQSDPIDLTALQRCIAAAPVVAFLKRVALHLEVNPRVEGKEGQAPLGLYQHVFRVDARCQLTAGLPNRVTSFGPVADITSLPVKSDLQILVWLDEIPIVGYQHPHLLMGADPWQLGNPSVPLIYPILKNWLSTVVRCEPHVDSPVAMIRLDDLPTTAEELLHRAPTPTLDRRRAATLRRLRRFAIHTGVRLNLMYTSHYYSSNGNLQSIGDVMPLSTGEIRLGVEQTAFEIGAHGMVHLRYPLEIAPLNADPREFLDLDENLTKNHLEICTEEIWRLFGVRPISFVAPAWGYRPAVTKKIAGQQFRVVIDSSQHVEDGLANPFSLSGDEYPALNCTETFRPGSSMLSYTVPEFWKCYALAGIPIHYMQHTDTNWHLVQSLLSTQIQQGTLSSRGLHAKLFASAQNTGEPLWARAIVAVLLLGVALGTDRASDKFIWRLLTRGSLYGIIRASCVAGYHCVGAAAFGGPNSQFPKR